MCWRLLPADLPGRVRRQPRRAVPAATFAFAAGIRSGGFIGSNKHGAVPATPFHAEAQACATSPALLDPSHSVVVKQSWGGGWWEGCSLWGLGRGPSCPAARLRIILDEWAAITALGFGLGTRACGSLPAQTAMRMFVAELDLTSGRGFTHPQQHNVPGQRGPGGRGLPAVWPTPCCPSPVRSAPREVSVPQPRRIFQGRRGKGRCSRPGGNTLFPASRGSSWGGKGRAGSHGNGRRRGPCPGSRFSSAVRGIYGTWGVALQNGC